MRRRTDPALLGAVALLVVAAITVLGFTRGLPLGDPYEIHAQFASANSIGEGAPVRIAGVDVGRVTQIEGRGSGARLTLAIEDAGRPIRADATAAIRPRIFLEGNFFVDLSPGTDAARELEDGGVLPVTRTSTPVQLDQVLTALQSDTRQDLRDVLDVLGRALDGERGAARSLNDAYADAAPALRATARVTTALLGEEPDRDLRRLLDGTGRATAALVRNEALLQALVRDLRVTFGALAGEQAALRATLRELPSTLAAADEGLAALDRAFPTTRAFARELLPGVRETAATIDAAFPWVRQATPLVSRAELGGLAHDLAPAAGDLARAVREGLRLFPAVDDVARCARDVVLPAGEIVIRDEFATGEENYKDFFYAVVGLAGEGQNGDGNGAYVRFQPGGGATTIALGRGANRVIGNAGAPPRGTRPQLPRRVPPYRHDVPCRTQGVPDVNGPAGARGPADRVIGGLR